MTTTDTAPATRLATPIQGAPVPPNSAPAAQLGGATQATTGRGGGPTSTAPAKRSPTPSHGAPVPPTTPPVPVTGPSAPRRSTPGRAVPDDQRGPARAQTTPIVHALGLADPLLALAADVLDDLERVRIANENRLRQLTRDTTDADGEERGFGLTLDHPDVARLAAIVTALGQAEHDAELQLARRMRAHPLGPWVAAQKGVGDKQGARLLASIGDPYIRPEIVRKDGTVEPARPRLVSELWAYCGHHVPDGAAARHRRGTVSNWNETARMRVHLIAEKTVMMLRRPCGRPDGQAWADHTPDCACGPWRREYDAGRRQYVGAVHTTPCHRCGPAGHPAAAGSPLSDAHAHGRAVRLVAKCLLRELWREAGRLHGHDTSPPTADHATPDAHHPGVRGGGSTP